MDRHYIFSVVYLPAVSKITPDASMQPSLDITAQ